MTTTTLSRNPFHVRALNWLRERMDVETELLPTNVLASESDPDHAYVRGHVVQGGHTDTLAFIALLGLLVAACLGMTAARPGFSEALTSSLQISAGALAVAAIALVVVDAWSAHARRRPVEIVVRARTADTVAPELIEKWRGDGRGMLWVVSENGFAPEALELARKASVRCFVPSAGTIAEVDAA